MNRYKLRYQTEDQRVFEVTVRADGMSDDGFTVRLWRKCGLLGLWRETLHYVAVSSLLTIFREDKL